MPKEPKFYENEEKQDEGIEQSRVIEDESQIGSNTIIGNHIQAGAITADKITVTNLSAIKADLGTITAGTITLDTSGYIRGGQTGYNTGTGFFLGYSGSAYKLSIGDSSGNYLTWDGTNINLVGVLKPVLVVSDILVQSADTSRTDADTSPVKVKEILIQFGGTLRIYFELVGDGSGGTSYGQIYKNGVAVGTLRSRFVSATWGAFTEDISGWLPEDLCQLYCYRQNGVAWYAQYFRIYGSILNSTLNLD